MQMQTRLTLLALLATFVLVFPALAGMQFSADVHKLGTVKSYKVAGGNP